MSRPNTSAQPPEQSESLPRVKTPKLRDSESGQVIDLRKHAWLQGRDDEPATSATGLNAVENLVVNHYHDEHVQLKDAIRAKQTALIKRFDDHATPPSTSGLQGKVDDAHSDVTIELSSRKDQLQSLRQRELELKEDLVQFKTKNNLQREAHYPASQPYHFSVVLLIFVIECLANMFFFAQGNDLGLLGGIFQSALISVVNVGFAILVGMFVARAARHVSPSVRFPALALLLFLVGVFAAFNLLASHYRDILSTTEGAVGTALDHMIESPLELTFHSILLFATGMGAAALGVYKGMTADDPYPGYGRLDRTYREAELESRTAREDTRLAALRHLESIRAETARLRLSTERKVDGMRDCVNELKTLRMNYGDRVDGISNECQRVLRYYRDENERIRVTPPPTYFVSFPDFHQDDGNPIDFASAEDWNQHIEEVLPEFDKVFAFIDEIDATRKEDVKMVLGQYEKALADIDAAARDYVKSCAPRVEG